MVYKDLKKTNFFSALSLPSFMRDWLLKKFEDENGNFDKDDMVRFVKKYIPRKDDWTSIKNRVIVEGERVKFLAKISIPNVQKVSDIEPREFKRYCLDRARKMRDTIKYQLGLLDVEYSGKDLPAFSVKGLE